MLALLALGASRELLGRGSLGADLHLLLGDRFAHSGWQVVPEAHGLLIALLPPGAFVLLGLMLALGQWRAAARRGTLAPEGETAMPEPAP
jgi:electron transport complex protein RnfE